MVFNQIQDPVYQFKVRDLFEVNAPIIFFTHLSITNIGLYLILGTFLILMFNYLSLNIKNIAANIWSTSKQLVYDTIYSIIIKQINALKGQNYFPFIYALFSFILVHNLIGMVPYDFASTTHFISTFSMSFTVVLGSTFIGFALYKLFYFGFFVPSGCPLLLLYLLVLIEFISYIARNFSLGLRLAANTLSGHMLLNILSEFTSKILKSIYFILALIPYIFVVMFSALEFGIAFIQAQVFAVLSSSYIKDGLSLH
uniref:ATP synthase subunit a n=1 Tax=Coccocarpia palmicola TaxID=301477 RepID=A0A1V0FWB7_9LECA|nr:ATP synthase subunit a [Coccocarpia palmicola]ARB49957.1 ATP synthase subunit a [Coccocarpia palmicola]